MLRITALLAVLLLAVATPVFADSIPPPIVDFAWTNTDVVGPFYSPTNYDLSGTNILHGTAICGGVCISFEVQDGVTTGVAFPNYGYVYNFFPGQSVMFGHLGKVSLNGDELTAIFSGKEGIVSNGVWSWYTVQGTFSDNISGLLKYPSTAGSGGIVLNRETYIGTAPVPEPETLATLVTGICSIAGLAVRKMRSI
jgi:hypothetical protein